MAKVKIQGHVSGTGILTVTAPNTSTDRTITLPDSTGTILDNTSTLDATKLSGNLPAISAASLTNVPKDVTVGGRKNMVINGAMQIAQRGTSQTAGGYGSLDRWKLALSGATATLSQETFTVGQTDVPNEPENYMKLNVTTGNNNCGFEHRVENVRSVVGVHTLSFWAKGVNPAGGEVIIKGEQRFDNSTNEVQITGDEITLTTSWQKFTISMTPTSLTGTGTPGASSYVRLQFLQPTGDAGTAAWNINIAQVQLERGSVATDFEHRSYGEELALCQRYFENMTQAGNEFRHNGIAWSTDNMNVPIAFLVEKRATPTIAITTTGDVYVGSWQNSSGNAVTGTNKRGCTVDIQKSSGYVVKYGYFIRGQTMTSDAEL